MDLTFSKNSNVCFEGKLKKNLNIIQNAVNFKGFLSALKSKPSIQIVLI